MLCAHCFYLCLDGMLTAGWTHSSEVKMSKNIPKPGVNVCHLNYSVLKTSRVHCFYISISWEYIRIMLDSVHVLIKACFPSIWHYCSTFGIGHIIGTCVHSIKKEWRYYCARMYTFVYLKYMLCNGF